MECRYQFLLYIYTVIVLFIGHTSADCRTLDDNSIFAGVTGRFHEVQRPSISTVFKTFFTNVELEDKCMSKHVLEATKSIRSSSTTSASNEYVRTYYRRDGSTHVVRGNLYLEGRNNYISWNGTADVDGVSRTGRMYILDVQPHQTNPQHSWDGSSRGSVVTFYTCFEGVSDIKKEATFIVQTSGGTGEQRENSLAAAKEYLNTLRIPSDLKEISCY